MVEETRQLGRYELIKRIAVGGMGVIYLAKSRGAAGFEKTVIIKKILEHLAEEPEFVTKFLDEGRIVVNLTHGNIVPVFDMGAEDGEYFIAMEYLPGRDLRDVLKRLSADARMMPPALAAYIAIEACKGLDYAHRRTGPDGEPLGIVHRDVSPSNILISRDGEVKIIDFGIARAASRASRSVSGRIQGKVCYMSPEQAGGKSVDLRSDVFSLGVVLYEMLTGERAFQGESDLESLALVRQCEFDPPSHLNPEVPPELDAIVARALAEDCAARYQSTDALQVDLLGWLYSRGRATTGQQLAGFVTELFPEGFERQELRRARDATSSASAAGAFNLDDALNAELAKLGGLDTADSFATRTASAPLDSADSAAANANDDAAPKAVEDAAPQTPAPAPAPTDAPVAEDSNGEGARNARGFKRWLAVALLLGLVVGGVLLYLFAFVDDATVEVQTVQPNTSKVDANEVAAARTRHVWITALPRDATITLNDGARVETGQAKIAIAPGEQVLVEASRPGCEARREVVTYQDAVRGVTLELECESASENTADQAANSAADGETNAQKTEPPPRKKAPAAPRFVPVTFASIPEGARIKVDDRPVMGPQRLKVGATVQLSASLEGYKPYRQTIDISPTLAPIYQVELEKLPAGCILIRPDAGQQVEVRIDGKSHGETTGARFDVPSGAHKVELIWGDGSASTYQVDVAASANCTGPLGFVRADTN